MNTKTLVAKFLVLLVALLATSCATRGTERLSRIEHIVVIYAENRSFDHLYGLFPGAEGIAQATAEQKTQLDHDGKPLPALPATYDPVQKGRLREDLPTAGLPNGPFRIDAPPINPASSSRIAGDRASYAALVLAKSVSPPRAGVSSA